MPTGEICGLVVVIGPRPHRHLTTSRHVDHLGNRLPRRLAQLAEKLAMAAPSRRSPLEAANAFPGWCANQDLDATELCAFAVTPQ